MILIKCLTVRCLGRVDKKSCHSPYCSKCRSRRFREKHPMMAHYLNLKSRAKERGHEFFLTVQEYEHFWVTSGYAEKHGKTKESLSIERKDNSRGYVADNIKAITLSENSKRMRNPYHGLTGREIAALRGQGVLA